MYRLTEVENPSKVAVGSARQVAGPLLMPRLAHYPPKKTRPACYRRYLPSFPLLPHFLNFPPLSIFPLSLSAPPLLSLVEFRDFDFSSKILGLLSPWTADLPYARDSKEAKKRKKPYFQNSRSSPVSIILYTSCPLFDTPPPISQCFTTLGCFHIPQRFPPIPFVSRHPHLFFSSSLALILVFAPTMVSFGLKVKWSMN
ncbi:hypothetical protein BDV39DRAFT_83919 [Aspergillus sergii]|uniref:Uncharacterized protein n=1 Tax=Aspergillus sergii TaxID=1034303 RepID=A0A5N6X247_9EURO|nr:hypothetical protein BDV39DRAFT_83919 [Aspergillus sergii]